MDRWSNRLLAAGAAVVFSVNTWATTTSVPRPDGLTDLTSPTGAAVTSEDLLNGLSPQKAFNDEESLVNTSYRFITANKRTATLVYTFDAATAVNAIGIQNFNNGDCQTRSPKAWTFWGSNDFDGTREGIGTASWEKLDERSDETGWGKPEYRYYQFDNLRKYKSYKISFSDTNGNSYLQLQKLEYFYYAATGVSIVGVPAECGDFSYDVVSPEIGSTVTLSAFDGTWTDAAGTTSAVCTGYELLKKNPETGDWAVAATGTGTSCSFTMEETSYELVWKFDRAFKVTVNAAERGSVSDVDDWYAEGSVCAPSVTPDEGYGFYKWDVAAGGAICAFDEAFFVTCPTVVTPVFAPVVALEPSEDGAVINAALAEAEGPLILRLADGIYKENSGTANCVVLDKPVRIEGTGADKVTVTRDTKIASARVFKLDHADAVVKGVTVSGGYGAGNQQPFEGGNVYITANGGTVMDAVIAGGSVNTYNSCGGNVRMLGGHLLRCSVRNGYTQTGYGAQGGGGICAVGASVIENCLITGNVIGNYSINAASAAAGVRLGGTAKMLNCTIVGNGTTVSAYGAVYADGSAQVVNCAIFGNTARDDGSGRNQTWGGVQAAYAGCYADVLVNGDCLQTATPAFVDAEGGDYSLSVSSPLRDAGTDYLGSGAASTADLRGGVRVVGTGVDVGAYEYAASGLTVDFTADGAGGLIPCTVGFSATVEGASGAVSYEWDFDGDGETDETTATGDVTHVFAVAGEFTVGLTVRSGDQVKQVSHEAMVKTCQQVLYVSAESTPEYPYASWESAAPSIADAVAASVDGCEIRVADGEYSVSDEIVVMKAVRILGWSGVPAAVRVRAADGAHVRVFRIDNASASVANMELLGDGAGSGRSVYIANSGASISNCVVHAGSYASIAWSAAGSAIYGEKAHVSHCVFTGNGRAHLGDNGTRGGIVHLIKSSRIENCLFRDCSVSFELGNSTTGGSILTLWDGSVAANCTVVACQGNTGTAAGIFADATSRAINCVVYDVRNGGDDPSAFWYSGTTANFVNCASASLSSDAFMDYANGDCRPKANGPLHNAGTLEGLVPEATDLAGRNRVQGSRIDIGCYEASSYLLVIIR